MTNHHPHGPSIASCRDDSTHLTLRAEWTPLDAVAQTWADFSLMVTSAHALQAVGNAFLALSCEMSAHRHYTQAHHGLWKLSPALVAQGLAEAVVALRETCQHWVCAYQWLERYANEERHDEEHMMAIREVLGSNAAQQHRLWLLLARVQEEQRSIQCECTLMVHLGPLSSVTVVAQEKEE